ncbi:hypothetical protein THAOC_24906, partial [Thalassiosira oceanica]
MEIPGTDTIGIHFIAIFHVSSDPFSVVALQRAGTHHVVCSSSRSPLREIDMAVPLFVASRPLAINISNLQSIAIFAVLSSSGSFLIVLFIANEGLGPLASWPDASVAERSLHRERPGPLVSWPDTPVSDRSLYHERPDPLASWPDACLSLFRSSPLARVGSSSFSSVAGFCR